MGWFGIGFLGFRRNVLLFWVGVECQWVNATMVPLEYLHFRILLPSVGNWVEIMESTVDLDKLADVGAKWFTLVPKLFDKRALEARAFATEVNSPSVVRINAVSGLRKNIRLDKSYGRTQVSLCLEGYELNRVLVTKDT